MNIVGSQIRQEGNSLIFRTVPAVGILALTSFTDDAVSTDPGSAATFIRKFRYSTNGVVFSEWIDLSIPNIVQIGVDVEGVLVIEVSYFKNEPAGSNYLSVSEITFAANQAIQDDSKNFYFNNSLFKKYFNTDDPDVLNWYINVLEKLYEKGLIPNYINRKAEDGTVDDFLSLFGSIAKFFAFYVKLARVFGAFYTNKMLIEDFLSQRGLQISPEDTLQDLQYMMETYYYQMSHRGGIEIIDRKSQGATIDGELLRTIHYKTLDEFIFCLYRRENYGWNLGHSSPLYRGLKVNENLNKMPWSIGYKGVANIGSYLTGGAISGDKVVFASGGNINVDLAHAVVVDPAMDYQLSFKIKTGSTFDFNLAGYNASNIAVLNTSRASGASTNNFFVDAKLSRNDKFIEVRCYLYNKNRGIFAGDTTNLKQGRNIIMNSNLKKVIFQIVADGAAEIKDLMFVPMMTEYSRGFVQSANFISAWVKNRNTVFSLKELKDFVSRHLIGYDSHIQFTNIGDRYYTKTETEIDSTYWTGAGEYCRKVLWVGIDPSCEIDNVGWVPDEDSAFCEQE